MWSDEAAEIMNQFLTRFDTMLMGRKTFEYSLKNAPPETVTQEDGGGMKTYVFSRTLKQALHRGVEILDSDPGEFVRELKKTDGKDICVMGGGLLANALFEADVIDEIGFNVHPILLGGGTALFHDLKRPVNLDLKECRQFRNGCVYLLYDVIH
jgi:dihydrofolate reductase